MFYKKGMAVFLLLAMLASTMTGCQSGEEETDEQDAPVTDEQTQPETEPETEPVKYVEQLESVDYGGADFRVQGYNISGNTTNALTMNVSLGELTGEIINDSLYERDLWLAEKYNVNVITNNKKPSKQDYINYANAGDNPYEFFWDNFGGRGYVLLLNGVIHAMNVVDGLHLDAPYWDQNGIEDLAFGDTVFFAVGPVTPTFYGCTYVLMFNREIVTDMNLPDMYTMVEEGTWTVDKFFEVADMADIDLNGDGAMTDDDQLGFMYSTTILDSILMGAGLNYLTWDGEKMVSNLGNEQLVNLMDKLLQKLQNESVRSMDVDPFDADKVLNNGTTLFYNPCTKDLATFRELEYDYGILPFPKENEAQKEYYNYGQPWAFTVPMILITNTGEQLSMTGTLLDAMAAYGYDYLRPAAYDNVLCLKGTRDEKSAEIIDLIFENIIMDIGTVSDKFCRSMGMHELVSTALGSQSYASLHASKKQQIQYELDELMESVRTSLARYN